MRYDADNRASALAPLAPDLDTLDERSRRAWTEPMAVRPLSDGRYAVDSRSGATYIVDLREGECTCPDNQIRGALCKHMRRVAIEISHGFTPSPDRPIRCRVCGREIEVDADAVGEAPFLCPDCRLEPGDLVFDREREPSAPMLVITVTDRRADEVDIPEAGCTVAEYGENRRYSPSDPVVDVIYPRSVGTSRSPRRYSYPLSRLEKRGAGATQTTLPASTAGS